MSTPNETRNSIAPDFWMSNPGITPKPANHKEFINPDELEWTDWLMPGTSFKLLFADLVSGKFTLLLKVDPGVEALPHWHVANVQAYIIEGGFYYDEDDQGAPGYYTCELSGNVHSPHTPENGCIMFAVVDGPIGGYHPETGSLAVMADARWHYYKARENNAHHLATIVDYQIGTTEAHGV